MERYKIVGSSIFLIPKSSLIYGTHLETMARQLGGYFKKIGSSVFITDEQQNVLVKGDLITKR